jgi:hypothetical protein
LVFEKRGEMRRGTNCWRLKMEGLFWSLAILVGPLILALGIGYVLLTRRRLTRNERQARREGTREDYREKEDA